MISKKIFFKRYIMCGLCVYNYCLKTNVVFPMGFLSKKKLNQDTSNLKLSYNLFIYMANTSIKIHCNKCMQEQFSFYNIINTKLLINFSRVKCQFLTVLHCCFVFYRTLWSITSRSKGQHLKLIFCVLIKSSDNFCPS